MAEHPKHASELRSSHGEPRRPTLESSFASRGSVATLIKTSTAALTTAPRKGHLELSPAITVDQAEV
jgi:hypothetical protein